jgi:probable selenium-dependent hydroxylase accessory protein YqeC
MWHFQRIDPFLPLLKTKYVSFVGSGGKSSLIEHIAGKAMALGKTVAITTTTKIFAREPFVALDQNGFSHGGTERFVRVGKTVAHGKLTAVSFAEVAQLGKRFDLVLIEADGAKGRPLKFPASYEPVIPPFSDRIVVVSGLDALGGRVDEKVFRWELFRDAAGIGGDALVTPEVFLALFSPDGLLKGVESSRCTIVLNKWDRVRPGKAVRDMAKRIVDRVGGPVVLSSLLFGFFYSIEKMVHYRGVRSLNRF